MTLDEALEQLKALGNESMRAHNTKYGAGDNQFGVKAGDIRVLAKKIKTDHELAMSLWETGNLDAQLLAILLIKPKDLAAEELDRMVRTVTFEHVADWFISYIAKKHPDKETLRQRWMAADDRWAARAGWSLTAERVVKNPEGLDLPGLLDRIESEMGGADPVVQWTMNTTLAEIGIHFSNLRKRGDCHGRVAGNLPGLSRVQGLYLTLRPDLDQRNGRPAVAAATIAKPQSPPCRGPCPPGRNGLPQPLRPAGRSCRPPGRPFPTR